MALDGAFLHHIKREIEERALDTRVDKIYMPNKDEIVLFLRGYRESCRLLLSARANTARVCFIEETPENPKQPPMLCMLLRKRLLGAKLQGVSQPGLERMLYLHFDAVNELGDRVALSLAAEVMGRYSNVILIDQEGKVIDALKRVDGDMSEARMILPGLLYRLPPPQDKICLLEAEPAEILARMKELPGDRMLSKALLTVLQGVSPVVCREFEYYTARGESPVSALTAEQEDKALFFLKNLRETVAAASGKPVIAQNPGEKPLDFSFIPIRQYGASVISEEEKDFSSLLERFFGERDRIDRMRVKSHDLLRLLSNTEDRLSRKINLQQGELKNCEKREYYRICGELLTANQYRVEKGASRVMLENYYEEGAPLLEIPLNPALSALQNAQKYYKDYRKSKTAEEKLREQIEKAQNELEYIDTVFEELTRAETEADLSEIRAELREQGYARREKNAPKRKDPPAAKPLEFRADGFTVLVGRNNRQNDLLTLKTARNGDLWFHTKNIPGSHVILVTEGKTPTNAAIEEAARLAARYSRAKDSSQVPVDYTLVKHVSKPQGAKPGKVIYVNYKTLFVKP